MNSSVDIITLYEFIDGQYVGKLILPNDEVIDYVKESIKSNSDVVIRVAGPLIETRRGRHFLVFGDNNRGMSLSVAEEIAEK